ncbi:hypothetical protein A3A75_04115 [Candidatus Woesebacteria bacterium RIFCSPLOWO2_01_FULL_39_10]|uniref:Mannosyl-glycoprotein endo-beta-N-acetylglucosamidase-like domain-containing protein n=2 Tax=Candidatus Woeseibacteriota TaxID=1752722 RepID=A0A1F8BA75_9BACT|nr:MAG: hypothetical protein A3A75_04115 [Candidatus Woesebacteria bacterium RIFCSPLOWO2_01_FULL_39_10]
MRMETQPFPRSESFWKKIVFIFVFFTITPLTLFSSVVSLIALSNSELNISKNENTNLIENPQTGIKVYASLPETFPSISGEVVAADARPVVIHNYLKANDSPLTPYAETIVQTADKYKLDYRLITAIGQKESGLGRAMPEGCNNAWGWGIHSEGTLCFDTWEEGIEVVSKGLKEFYVDLGYETVEEIMSKYAHPDSTTWAEGVLQYMSQME